MIDWAAKGQSVDESRINRADRPTFSVFYYIHISDNPASRSRSPETGDLAAAKRMRVQVLNKFRRAI